MLTFLGQIWNKLVELFVNVWSRITWLVYSAFNSISEYTNNLASKLRDYAYNKVSALDWYKNVAKSKSDYIDVTNFPKTTYSAIDSYPAIADLRNNLLGKIRDFVLNTLPNVKYIFSTGYNALQALLNTPVPKLLWLFLTGVGVVQQYEGTERPTLRTLMPNVFPIMDFTSEPKRGKIAQLTDLFFPKVQQAFVTYWDTIVSLVNNAHKIIDLTVDNVFRNIKQLATSDYSGLRGLVDIYSKIKALMELTPYQRLLYLTGDEFLKLLNITQKPEPTIFAVIEEKFVNWFFDRFFRWLFYEK